MSKFFFSSKIRFVILNSFRSSIDILSLFKKFCFFLFNFFSSSINASKKVSLQIEP